jgi:hypothetical protein
MHDRYTHNCFSKHLKKKIIVLNVEIMFLLMFCWIWRTKKFCISLVIGFRSLKMDKK